MNRYILVLSLCFTAFTFTWATPLHTAIDSAAVTVLDSLLKATPDLLEAPNEAGESPLFYAAKTGKTDCARTLLAYRADVTRPDRNGVLPIHIAAQQGSLAIVRMLIEAGADPRATDAANGSTALHCAAEGGNCETLEYLISLGLDIQNPDRATFTPLMRAASQGRKEAFDLLLARGAACEIGADLNNGLMAQAAGGGNIAIAKLLLDRGFDVNARSPNLSAPIHIAVWLQRPEMVKYLLSRGARLEGVRNRYGSTPMHSAAARNDTAMAAILAANGCLIDDSSTQDYSSPLHMAGRVGSIEMIRFLLDRGADVNRLDRGGGTPLGWAVQGAQLAAADLLISRGAIIDPTACPEKFGCAEHLTSPLHGAAMQSPTMVAFLLEKGANPNSRDSDSGTPLMYSIWGDSIRCMDLLLQRGADPNAVQSAGNTALHRAVQLGRAPQTELLINHGADPNLSNDDGLTSLHLAAIGGYDTLAGVLIAGGAGVNVKDKQGHRPLYYAQYHGHERLADFLKSEGAKGGAKSVASGNDLLARELNENEAIVWYLNHSGWAIKTQNHLMIFDYFPPELSAANASLMNGRINPQELSTQNLSVFASHEHGDHAHPEILRWSESNPEIRYFFGVPPERWDRREPDMPTDIPYTLCRPGEEITDDGIEIRPIKSDIDQGCGFLITVDGMTIFHPGDVVDTSRMTPSRYTRAIDSLASNTEQVDLFFFPIRGCGFPDLEAVKKGIDYTISTLHPRVALPMHARNSEYELRDYVHDARARNADANYYCVRQPGDRFFYSKGKVKPL